MQKGMGGTKSTLKTLGDGSGKLLNLGETSGKELDPLLTGLGGGAAFIGGGILGAALSAKRQKEDKESNNESDNESFFPAKMLKKVKVMMKSLKV